MDKKAISIALILIFFGLFGVRLAGDNLPHSEKALEEDILIQFRKFLAYNEGQASEGREESYIFEYYAGQEWTPPPCTTWVKESGASLIEANAKCDLNTLMDNFNTNNQDGIKVYSVYIHPPAFTLKTEIPTKYSTANQVIGYLKDKGEGIEASIYQNFIDSLLQQIENEIDASVYGSATEKILVLSSFFKYKGNKKDEYSIVYRVKTEGTIVSGHEAGIDLAVKANTSGILASDYAGVNYLILATQAIMDFFSDPDLIAGSTVSSSTLLQILQNQTAKDFFLEWYDDYSEDHIKKYVFAIAQYIDRLDPLFPYDPASPDHQLHFGWAESAIVEYYNTISQYAKWREFVASRIDKAYQEFQSNNGSDYYKHIAVWYQHVQEVDYQTLTWQRRAKLLEMNQFGWDSQNWIDWNVTGGAVDLAISKSILAPATQHSASDINSLLTTLGNVKNLPEWLFEMADVLIESQNSEQDLMDILTKLAIQAAGYTSTSNIDIATDFKDKTFPWKPVPWYSLPVIKYSSSIDVSGPTDRVKIEQGILEDCTYNCSSYYYGGCPPNCTYDTTPFDLQPFELVAVTLANKMNFLVGCGEPNGDCKNETIIIPAIVLAWMIEKKGDDDLYNGIMTSIDVISLFFGAGELMVAIKAANRAKMFLAGWSVMSDLSSIWLATDTDLKDSLIANYGQTNGNKYYSYLQIINTLNGLANGFVGFLDVDDAAEAVASYKHLEKTGFDYDGALTPAQKKKLDKKMADTEAKLIETGNEGKILEKIASYVAKANATDIANKYGLGSNPELAAKLADIEGSARLLDNDLAAKINGLQSGHKTEFLEDLVKSPGDALPGANLEVKDLIQGLVPILDNELVDTWSYLRTGPGVQIKRDSRILLATHRFRVENTGMPAGFFDDIRIVMDRMSAAGAGCKSCRTNTAKDYMNNLDVIVDQLNFATKEYSSLPKFYDPTTAQTLIGEMKQTRHKAKGGALVLDAITFKKQAFFGEDNIFSFELNLGSLVVDVTTVKTDGTLVLNEFKNWDSTFGSEFGLNRASFVSQFANSLDQSNSLEELKVFFNTNRFYPSADQLRLAFKENIHEFDNLGASKLDDLVESYFTAIQKPNPYGSVTSSEEFIDRVTSDDGLRRFIFPMIR